MSSSAVGQCTRTARPQLSLKHCVLFCRDPFKTALRPFPPLVRVLLHHLYLCNSRARRLWGDAVSVVSGRNVVGYSSVLGPVGFRDGMNGTAIDLTSDGLVYYRHIPTAVYKGLSVVGLSTCNVLVAG